MTSLHALPHHDGSELYAPVRTPVLGGRYAVRLRIPTEFGRIESAAVRVVSDGEPCFYAMAASEPVTGTGDGCEWWTGEFDIPNPVTRYRFLLNTVDGDAWWLSADGVDRIEPTDNRDFRVTTFDPAPEWAASQVMYQIFPDRFARSAAADDRALPDWAQHADWTAPVISTGPDTSRQWFGGDLDGIVEHLDHLERLGVTLIYLTPFFPARSNHRYDASTFEVVDPLLGGDAALIRLVEAAHGRGMRVIGDLTTNHTGAAHEWFTAALGNPSAEESDFYYWTNPQQTEYVAWYGVPSLPKLDWASDTLCRRFIEGPESVLAKWLQPPFNLDGWRIDVANMTGRLRDVDLNREVQRTVRQTMDTTAPGRVLYAESTNDAAGDFDGEGWQAPMSYSAFTRPVWHWLREPSGDPAHHFGIPFRVEPRYSAADVVKSYRNFTAPYPWAVRELAMNAIDTHDTPRFAQQADDAAQIVAAGLSMTLPGTPVIFAGDEFGLHGTHGEDSRTPLPWGTTPRLADAYGGLARLRVASRALQRGGLRWLHADDECMIFVRETSEEALLVFASSGAATVELPRVAVGAVGEAAVSFGDTAAEQLADVIRITSTGLAFAVWHVVEDGEPVAQADAGRLVDLARA
ncbi:glycoside hydrolase family 13 protein [Microbacterium bovistercoris]|uniref:Glycoside hydrolase family 13 protein n=1 Tax=Microbacterium bovistercoris TaxID=2293570 RepID=A0A371NV77_9MICO|nr:alpha-amylase family glycosyl hydrolase [Microbacterium bovistercoris]REJ06237.1 glycoside hydrolase family 13 protein [Microbacterium bovistercoris]